MALFLLMYERRIFTMKKTLYIFFIFALMAGSLSAKKRPKSKQKVVVETIDSTVVADSLAKKIYEFTMILVGKTSFSPDSAYVRLSDLPNDTLQIDSLLVIDKHNKDLMDFFVRNIVYPNQLKDKNAEDVLKLRLKLDKEGKIVLCEVLDAQNSEMKNEVLRVSKLLPTLFPSDKKGKPTDVTLELPISFKLLKL